MIYSASRRTDLPAFFPDFITEKIRRSRKLEAIVFWTKDPRNLVSHPGLHAAILRYPAVIQLTVTGLAGSVWEPEVPALDEMAPAIHALAHQLPQGAIRWRFDPILVTEDLLSRFHTVFQGMRAALGALPSAVISFPAPYAKVTRRLAQAGQVLPAVNRRQKAACLARLLQIARVEEPDFIFETCCQPDLLGLPGTRPSTCIDPLLLDKLYQTSFGALQEAYGQRAACHCRQSTDIGRYDQPCRHNCLYCYAGA